MCTMPCAGSERISSGDAKNGDSCRIIYIELAQYRKWTTFPSNDTGCKTDSGVERRVLAWTHRGLGSSAISLNLSTAPTSSSRNLSHPYAHSHSKTAAILPGPLSFRAQAKVGPRSPPPTGQTDPAVSMVNTFPATRRTPPLRKIAITSFCGFVNK